MTISELQKMVPDFNWLVFLNQFLPEKVDATEEIVVFSPKFLKDMVALVRSTDKRFVAFVNKIKNVSPIKWCLV